MSNAAEQPDRSASEPGRCLVTGATGFIGARVATRLVSRGRRVRCLVRATSDVSMLTGEGIELVRADLTDLETLSGAADGCDCVVHCGALVSDWATVDEIRRANVVGTSNLLEVAAAASVRRFVHMSTTDVYGYPGTPKVDERSPSAGFANWYAQTKREAEAQVRRAATRPGFEITILRPATVYGPGSEAVVGEMAKALRRGQMLMVDHGRAVAGLVYVENLVDAVLVALDDGAAAGEDFNVTDGLDVTWRRFLGDLAAGLGYRPPRWSIPYGVAVGIAVGLEHGYRAVRRATKVTSPALLSRQAVHVLGRDQDFSNVKLRDTLGWEPRASYAAGLDATVAWLRDEYLLA